MTSTADATETIPVFHLELTDEGTIALPPELRERLGVEAGDVLAISVVGNQARVSKATKADADRSPEEEPTPPLRGLLRDYFADWDDVKRFVDQERGKADEHPDEDEPALQLEGLLEEYFADREDVRRFIEEERRGWEEREAKLGL